VKSIELAGLDSFLEIILMIRDLLDNGETSADWSLLLLRIPILIHPVPLAAI
jgi:hypothetical protein